MTRVLFVHAHSGDATIEAGATIEALVAHGDEVEVVAVDALLAASPFAESLSTADFGEMVADIAAAIYDAQPQLVVSHGAGDGHPEHRRVYEATRRATEVLGVPYYVASARAGARAVTVDARPALDRKRAAITAHLERFGPGTAADGDAVAGAPGAPAVSQTETFARLRPLEPRFADHSLGSRIVACVVALAIGAFAGATLTAAHQASAGVFPWGIVVAVALTAALLAGLRMVFGSRIVAMFAAIGLLGTAALLAAVSAGGSVLVPANPAGYTWTFAPVLIALVVLGWPRIARPSL